MPSRRGYWQRAHYNKNKNVPLSWGVFFDNGVNMLLDKKTGCFFSLLRISKKYQINWRPQVAPTFEQRSICSKLFVLVLLNIVFNLVNRVSFRYVNTIVVPSVLCDSVFSEVFKSTVFIEKIGRGKARRAYLLSVLS